MALKWTAKSCGPDASTLAFKSRKGICKATVTKSPITGESAEETVNTIACGNAGFSGATVVTNARVYYHYTRGCGCIEHPAFPTPSDFRAEVKDITRAT